MVYMSFDTFSNELHTREDRDKRLEEYPFLKYAVDHWGSHVFQCYKGPVLMRAWAFLMDDNKLRSAFQVMSDFPFLKESGITGLHMAAHFGLTKLVEKAYK